MNLNQDQNHALDQILDWINDPMAEPTMALTGPAGNKEFLVLLKK